MFEKNRKRVRKPGRAEEWKMGRTAGREEDGKGVTRAVRTLSLLVAIGMVTIASPGAAQQAVQPAPPATPLPSTTVVDLSKQAFWEVFSDTTLNRLMAEALGGSRELRAAAARRDGAGAAHMQAALNLVPAVTANAGYTRRRLSSATFPMGGATLPDQGLWDSALAASWEVDLFGRLRGGVRAQNALLGSASEDVREAQVALTADMARTYLDLRGAQEQMAVARRNADNQRRTLELTQARLDAGRGTAFDTERARAQLSLTQAVIPALEARIAAAQYRIAVLAGREPQSVAAELGTALSLPVLPDSVRSISAEEVIRTRPDVSSAESRLAASRAVVSAARADYLPRLSLVAGAGYTASAVDRFGNDGTFNYVVGPVISWPAFDMGRVKARADEAQAQELEARARFEHAVLLAREQLATTTVRYRAARARLGLLREAAAASERAADLARLRYEGGVADFLQVLDAERTVLAAQDQLAQARTEAVEAYVALARARGASWPVHE
ncbi:MAG: TolC family protein [Longimicrobiales bacterium]